MRSIHRSSPRAGHPRRPRRTLAALLLLCAGAAAVVAATVASPRPARAVEPLLRGDADGSGGLEITDAILVLNFLFSGGKPPVCAPAADTNADGAVNLSDAIALLAHLFLGSPAPEPLTAAEASECGGADPEAITRGIARFELPDPDGNAYACSLCHSMSPDDASAAEGGAVMRTGSTLVNSLHRPSYKQGGRDSFLGAVNVCRKDWMGVLDAQTGDFVPWTEDDGAYKDLVAFVESLSTADSAPALEYDIVAPARSGGSTGDPAAGCELFERTCRVCHGEGGAGTLTLGPSLLNVASPCTEKSDLCLDAFCQPAPEFCLDNPDYIRRRIRLSGPFSDDQPYRLPPGEQFVPSPMPFWTAQKLSDAQVEDLVAFVLAARQAVRDGTVFDCSSAPPDDGAPVRRGSLAESLHGVSGTVEELDSHRLRFTDLRYDGGGIEVRVWVFKEGAPGDGQAVGPDLFGRTFDGDTLIVELPAGLQDDAFDSVSIRCLPTGRDFAAAALAPVQ